MMRPYYLLGIGGVGMSALAHILLDRGEEVFGEDIAESATVDRLKKRGAKIVSQISSTPTVVYSSAIPADHPRFLYAKKHQLPLIHRSLLLEELMGEKKRLLIAGTHGKTSTSALLAHIFSMCGLDPSFAIGGEVPSLGTNGREGRGEYFIAEADESDGSFLCYSGQGGIITNIEPEHLNYWKTEQNLVEGFVSFAKKIADPSLFFWCADDPRLKKCLLPGFSYGRGEDAALRMTHLQAGERGVTFRAEFQGQELGRFHLPFLGEYQGMNALAACGLAFQLGLNPSKINQAFKTFRGVRRRLEKKGEVRGIVIYDDYAHHPTEIKKMLGALRTVVGLRRLIAVFEPHRYSRTAHLMEAFATAFCQCDLCVITDLVSAGEAPIEGISGEVLFQRVSHHQKSYFFPRNALATELIRLLNPQDVVVSIGAGGVSQLGAELIRGLR